MSGADAHEAAAQAASTPRDGRVLRPVHVLDEWLDARGELGVAFYTAAFDLGIDALKQSIGIDEPYRLATRRSTVALEAHLVFVAPVPAGAEIVVGSRIVDRDAKRIHVAQDLRHDAVLAATRESMTISFDLDTRRSCAFDAAILARIDALYTAQRTLPLHVGTAQLLGVGRASE